MQGCAGIGRHIAQRLVADGETVLDVPAKLSARVRVFDTGQGRKTDPVDAHSVAVAGLRSPGLRQVQIDDATVALRLMVDRRAELGRTRTEVVNRIHQMLLELIPGGAKKFLTRGQASYLLRTAPAPVGIVAQTRHQLARELIDELTIIDTKIRAADKQLRQLVAATGSCLAELNGIGPSGAARLIGDIGDIARFATAAHFASWNGTTPIEASSGDQKRHRLSRAGNRRINRVLHIMAVVQLRHDTPGPRLLPAPPDRGQNHDGSTPRAQTPPLRRGLQADGPRRQTSPHQPDGPTAPEPGVAAVVALNPAGTDLLAFSPNLQDTIEQRAGIAAGRAIEYWADDLTQAAFMRLAAGTVVDQRLADTRRASRRACSALRTAAGRG